jgi:endonuclease YncB( thermonuclease family)
LNVEATKTSAQLAVTSNRVVSRKPFKVTRVVDGDTLEGAIKDTLRLTFSTIGTIVADVWLPDVIRLQDIDTPEKKTDDGQRALYFVGKWIEDHEENIELEYTGKREKYGRLLGVVYAGDETLQQALLDNYLAVPYKGGKR